MLDVGQGLAMVIARNGKAILYDTGLAWPEGDSGQQLIIPWLHWHNLEPEGVILSHEHLDHRGGLDSILHILSLIHISEPTRQAEISYAVFCLKKKKKKNKIKKKKKCNYVQVQKIR